jgi:hypothetical protein
VPGAAEVRPEPSAGKPDGVVGEPLTFKSVHLVEALDAAGAQVKQAVGAEAWEAALQALVAATESVAKAGTDEDARLPTAAGLARDTDGASWQKVRALLATAIQGVEKDVHPVEGQRGDEWRNLRACFLPPTPSRDPATQQVPWDRVLVSTSMFLRMDLSVALRKLLLASAASFLKPDATLDPILSRVRAHEPQSEVEPLRAAAQALLKVANDAGVQFGLQLGRLAGGVADKAQADHFMRVSQLAGLAAFLAVQRLVDSCAAQPRLKEACAALLNLLVTRWAERLAFGRDDLGDEEDTRMKTLRQKEKVRRMEIVQRLDSEGRDLKNDLKRMKVGALDWDMIEKKLAHDRPVEDAAAIIATPGQTDARAEYW